MAVKHPLVDGDEWYRPILDATIEKETTAWRHPLADITLELMKKQPDKQFDKFVLSGELAGADHLWFKEGGNCMMKHYRVVALDVLYCLAERGKVVKCGKDVFKLTSPKR